MMLRHFIDGVQTWPRRRVPSPLRTFRSSGRIRGDRPRIRHDDGADGFEEFFCEFEQKISE